MLLQLFIVFTFSFNFNLAIIEINAPIVITTWAFTNATSKAWDVLKVGGKALDAVEQGASVCEEMQCDGTVGYGGSPDENGETTLDALIMDGKTMNVGAVGALRRVKNAISVARRVLDHTQHSILVGDQATQFAVQMGFREESLSTPESKDLWTEWHKDKHCQPNFWIDVEPDPKEHCGPYHDLNAKTTTEKPKTDKPEDEKCHDEKAHDEKAHAEKAHAEKPHTEKCHTDKPHAEKPHAEKPHDEKPHTEKCHTEKPHAEKPHAEKPHAEKPHDEKPHTENPHTEKPHAEKPHAEKCHTEKPHAEKAHAEKCHTEKPHAEKPHTDKVHAEKAHTEKIKTEKSKPPEVHMMVDRYNHDTIGMVAIDGYGDLAAATSTNGAKFKIPGRLGDSPIPGAGAYVDNEVGGAAATGDGDVMLRFLPSFTAVDEMRRGAMPDDAARTAIKKIAAYYPNFMGAVIALTKTGLHGAACHGLQKFPYVVQDDSKGTCEVIEVTCEIKCC